MKSSHAALNVTGLSQEVSFSSFSFSVIPLSSVSAHLLNGSIIQTSPCGAQSQYHQEMFCSSFYPFLPSSLKKISLKTSSPYLLTCTPCLSSYILTYLTTSRPTLLPTFLYSSCQNTPPHLPTSSLTFLSFHLFTCYLPSLLTSPPFNSLPCRKQPPLSHGCITLSHL